MTTYEFDTGLDPNFPVLTRGNAGEIMPDIVSPLSATVMCSATGVEKRRPVARMVCLNTPSTTASAPSTSTWLTALSVCAVSHTTKVC